VCEVCDDTDLVDMKTDSLCVCVEEIDTGTAVGWLRVGKAAGIDRLPLSLFYSVIQVL